MSGIYIGLDIGGTKIAGAAFDKEGRELAQMALPTPLSYDSFLETCRSIIDKFEQEFCTIESIGACCPYADDNVSANMPALIGKNLKQDLEKLFGRSVPFGNDANCAALAEAKHGAGKGYAAVFGLILGTGVGGGFVLNGKLLGGANGICGEIGHIPMPYYAEADGERVLCGCGQVGCIEKMIAGPALSRRYLTLTGKQADAREIANRARLGDTEAAKFLDDYYTLVAKALVVVLHSFDPDIITVSGGLNALPGLYTEVPKRWGQYALNKNPITKIVPAAFGAVAGVHGAAWLSRDA